MKLSHLFQRNFYIIWLLLCSLPKLALSTIFPNDNAILNFTQVMFEYDETAGSDNYILTIENWTNPSSKKIILKNKTLAVPLLQGLVFGNTYKWHWEAFQGKKKLFTSASFRFTIESSNLTDPNQVEIRITKNNPQLNPNNIFLLDYLGVAINRKGNIIWYMPRSEEKKKNGDSTRRSLRMTTNGSFTYLDNTNCYEKDIFGHILWQTPNDGKISGDSTEYYHHDFRKLSNQTYIACSYKFIREPHFFDLSKTWKVRYNTVIQYDSTKKVIWFWNEKDHVDGSLIFENGDPTINDFPGTHMNGFDYDDRQNAFIFSFRNTSRILKVDYTTKEVQFELGRYRTIKNSTSPESYTLANQHGPAWMPDSSILIYDNNFNSSGNKSLTTNPHLLIIRQPSGNQQERKIWDYECVSDSFPKGQSGKEGYAMPMYNGNIMACQGSTNRLLEVTRKKELVWEAFCFENKSNMPNEKVLPEWKPFLNYRTFAVSSLYPTYFTLQHLYDTRKKEIKNKIQINNEGSDEKKFTIAQYSLYRNEPVKITEIILKSRRSKEFKFIPEPNGYLKIFPSDAENYFHRLDF